MHWESLGFTDNPFQTRPILEATLNLYTGNRKKYELCSDTIQCNNSIIVIEGSRGVGTTSFANYLRFNAKKNKTHFTPIAEIRVEPNWNADNLMSAAISNIVTSLELNYSSKLSSNSKFNDVKAVVKRVADTYRSFSASGLGFGASYGKAGAITQPTAVSTQILANYLEDLIDIIKKLGFKYGVLIQLDNLDIGTMQNKNHLKMLLNVMRDYLQMPYTNWLLVGDVNLRKFIAQNVDRVDDIIAFETYITPLSQQEYMELIANRIEYYRINNSISLPIEDEVWQYLYKITKGRLRYIFGLIARLFNSFQLGTSTDFITLEQAKPLIFEYAKERVGRFKLTGNEEMVLQTIVDNENIQVKEIAIKLEKKDSYISGILTTLQNYNLVGYKQQWRSRYYYPKIDAYIAFSKYDIQVDEELSSSQLLSE